MGRGKYGDNNVYHYSKYLNILHLYYIYCLDIVTLCMCYKFTVLFEKVKKNNSVIYVLIILNMCMIYLAT